MATQDAYVLTISDSSFQGARADISGPAVAARLQELGWTVQGPQVLPDEQSAITARLLELCAIEVGAIFTTGGTGVAPRDVTPEATRAVLEKELPGFGELMRAEGRKATRYADLSRAIAGIRGKSVIVNLPGSPKGALESLNAIVGLVSPVLELLRDDGSPQHHSKGGLVQS